MFWIGLITGILIMIVFDIIILGAWLDWWSDIWDKIIKNG